MAPSHAHVLARGRAKRWTGESAGRVLSREIDWVWGADTVYAVGRQHAQWRYRKPLDDLAWSKTPSMHGHSMCENREIRWLPASDGAAGRIGKAKAVSR
jgi:hypothetical protein